MLTAFRFFTQAGMNESFQCQSSAKQGIHAVVFAFASLFETEKNSHLLMYSTIKVQNGIQATPQGRRLYHAGVGFELAIKRRPARCLDH